MDAHKDTLGNIFNHPIRYVAPLFQRPYVWNKVDHWEPLWHAFTDILERRTESNQPRPYFLGTIVLDKGCANNGTVRSREIVDGQQRLITLQIMLEAARRVFHKNGYERQAFQLYQLLYNFTGSATASNESLLPYSEEQYKVWPSQAERTAYRCVMDGKDGKDVMTQAMQYFTDVIDAWFEPSAKGAKNRANAFVRAVNDDLVFVIIELSGCDDCRCVFETINSSATPLLPSDLVKNHLIRALSSAGLNTDKLFSEHWKQFEEDPDYWRMPLKWGRTERTRLDIYIQIYQCYRLNRETYSANPYRDYRAALENGAFGSMEEALCDFARHARLYRLFDHATVGAAGSIRSLTSLLKTNAFTPLILGLLSNVDDYLERDAMFQTLESYLVRRVLCGLPMRNANRTSASLIAGMQKDGWSNGILRDRLLAFEGNGKWWPDDDFVQSTLTHRNAYGVLKTPVIVYILSRIEGSLRATKSGSHPSPWTVVHIMPRHWECNWPLQDPGEMQQRNNLIHRIGNLTLVSGKLKLSQTNAAWNQKRHYLDALQINSDIVTCNTWTESDIIERSHSLANRICRIWER